MKRWVLLLVLFAAACGKAEPVVPPTPTSSNWHTSEAGSEWVLKERVVGVRTDSLTSYTYKGMDTAAVGKVFTPQLWTRCRNNKIEIYIDMGAFVDLGSEKRVRLQFWPKFEEHWLLGAPDAFDLDGYYPLSEDGTAIFAKDTTIWMWAMSGNQRLRLSIPENDGSHGEAMFNLTGYHDAVKPVLEACIRPRSGDPLP